MEQFDTALKAGERAFLATQGLGGLDLFAGTDQQVAVPGWPPSDTPHCSDAFPAHAGGLSDSLDLLPALYRVHARLTVHGVRACVEGVKTAAETGSTRCSGLNTIRKWRVHARYFVSVQLTDASWQRVRAREATSGYYQQCEHFPNDDEALQRAWPELVGLLNNTETQILDDEFRDQVVGVVRDRLRARQQQLYGELAAQLGVTGDLRDPAERLAGAKALIDALVTLGFPRAIESDELSCAHSSMAVSACSMTPTRAASAAYT